MKFPRFGVAGIVFVCASAAVLLAPLVATPYIQSVLLLFFMYVALAASWNLIGGYAGYFSFGHIAYFGLGSYVAALLILKLQMPWLLAATVAALAAAAAAAVVGYPSLRVKGPAFVIITLAFSQALRVAVYIFEGITGGGQGMSLSAGKSLEPVYLTFAAAAAVGLAGTWLIDRSGFGQRLRAIRDDEFAAEAIGIDTRAEKLKAFVLSALLPGFCGGVYAWYLSYVHPEESFSLHRNLAMIVMVLLGGAGTVFGPVAGAALVFLVSEALWAKFPLVHELVFGLALMALVLFAPDGLAGIVRRWRPRPQLRPLREP